jgi:hypothetical protein
MNRVKNRGFLLGELAVALTLATAVTSIYALSSTAVPEIERLCVGSPVSSETARSSRALSDARRWFCVAVSSPEPPEYRYAGRPSR